MQPLARKFVTESGASPLALKMIARMLKGSYKERKWQYLLNQLKVLTTSPAFRVSFSRSMPFFLSIRLNNPSWQWTWVDEIFSLSPTCDWGWICVNLCGFIWRASLVDHAKQNILWLPLANQVCWLGMPIWEHTCCNHTDESMCYWRRTLYGSCGTLLIN